MANMSYCRWENTAKAFKDCLYTLDEALEDGLTYAQFFATLSEDEQYWFKRMTTLASEFELVTGELKSAQAQEEY